MTEASGLSATRSKILPEILGSQSTDLLFDGREVKVVQLNNAATTPPFKKTMQAVNSFLENYGALHRGAGPRARRTFLEVEEALANIRAFLNCPPDHSFLFSQNTSTAINQMARLLPLTTTDVVMTTEIEHTSNNLPWRFNTPAQVVEIRAFDNGAIDYADLETRVNTYRANLKVITISGASNQTGYIPDLPRIARLAHSCGALFFVDAAQLAPHRPIDMVASGIDALAFSAHKIYSPFGLGVLALPSHLLERQPVDPGGGSIDMITNNEITWAPSLERHQTGTWNGTGVVALGASCATLRETGWEAILDHEKDLVEYAATRLAAVPGLTLYVKPDLYKREDRIGTFPFNLTGFHQSRLAAILEHEYGIEVRAGTICNHRLVRRWLGISDTEQAEIETALKAGNRLATYGIVRASLAIHNTRADIDSLAEALTQISLKGPRLEYTPVQAHETYEPIL
jgi:selenocysteine lyase/cysteine desulfurase